MPYTKITQDMLNNIAYDNAVIGQSEKLTGKMADTDSKCTPTVLIVADKADLNAAAYHLAHSLQYPFSSEVVVTVLVAESTRAAFQERLLAQMKAIPTDVSQHAGRNKVLTIIAKHNWESISAPELGANSPVIVCDVTHEHLGNGYNGVVTLHTFRTIQESISLCGKESIKPVNASIWSSNHAIAYEIALKIPSVNIFIDCYQVSLEPLETANASASTGSCALVEQNYHYETLKLQNGTKNVVFPIGTAIAN